MTRNTQTFKRTYNRILACLIIKFIWSVEILKGWKLLYKKLSPLKLRNDFIRYDMLQEGDNLEKVTDKIMDRSFALGLWL